MKSIFPLAFIGITKDFGFLTEYDYCSHYYSYSQIMWQFNWYMYGHAFCTQDPNITDVNTFLVDL